MATHQADIMQLVRDILAQQMHDPRQARAPSPHEAAASAWAPETWEQGLCLACL